MPRLRGVVVEDKANGPALESMLKDRVPGLIMVSPKGGKMARTQAISPMVEAGQVYVPTRRNAPTWIDETLEEWTKFPFGRYDDRVDTMTQALAWQHLDGLNRSMQRMRGLVAM